MTKSKTLIATLGLALSLSLVGCSSSQPFSEADEKAFVSEYSKLASQKAEPKVLEEKLHGNIGRLSKQEASNAIDSLLYAMYQQLPTLQSKLQGMHASLLQLKKEGIDLNDPASLNKITDTTLKAYVSEVQEKEFFLYEVGGRFDIKPNMGIILQKYEPYMEEDLKQMVRFNKEEYENSFYDDQTKTFKMDLLASRLITVEENLKTYPNSPYKQPFQEIKDFYYQTYFGMNSELLLDNKKMVRKDVLDHYENTIKAHPNSELAKDLTSYLAELKKSNYQITDNVYAFLDDLISESIPAQQQPQSNSGNALQNALQNAIKENSK